jgi:hypothetical protein
LRPNSSRPFRKIREYLGVIFTAFLLLVDFGAGVFNLKPKLSNGLSSKDLIEKSHKRVAIYAGYINTESEVIEAERILKLLSNEFDLLILVNTGSRELKIVLPNFLYFRRENFGRDLASYKYAVDSLHLKNTSELFFFNDSVFWTGKSVFDFVESARQKDSVVTALTSSDQYSYHLQSYALHLKGDIAELSKAFSKIRISNFKRVIVEAGEKRLSNYWLTKKVKIGCIYNQDSLSPLLSKFKDTYGQDYEYILDFISQGVPLNPSIHFWAPLYAQSGVVKKALLQKNPAQLKDVPKTLLDLQSKVNRDKSQS